MSLSPQEQVVILSLHPMFAEAEEKGLWFYSESGEQGEVWCSPGFLKTQQSQGRMIWSPEHWELRNPLEYMARLHADANRIVVEYNEMARRLKLEQTLSLTPVSSNPAQLIDA